MSACACLCSACLDSRFENGEYSMELRKVRASRAVAAITAG